jgi:peptide/nickel transport system ATP-binding protein
MVEFGPAAEVIERPRHRYTQALVAANPGIADDDNLGAVVNRPLDVIPGSVPALGRFPSGCRFRGRCAWEIDLCAQPPEVSRQADGHLFKCWNPTADALGEGAADVAR